MLSTWLFQQRGPRPTEEKQKARMRSQGTGRLGGQTILTACCVLFQRRSPGFPQTHVPTNLGHVYYRTDQRSETRVQFPWAETLDPGQWFLLMVQGAPRLLPSLQVAFCILCSWPLGQLLSPAPPPHHMAFSSASG